MKIEKGDIIIIKERYADEYFSLFEEEQKRSYELFDDRSLVVVKTYGDYIYASPSGFKWQGKQRLHKKQIEFFEKAFKNLNDVPIEGFQKGKTEIWYLKSWKNRNEYHPWELKNDFFKFKKKNKPFSPPKTINKYHTLLGKIILDDIYEIVSLMQAGRWCFGKRCNNMIMKHETHTSMSSGDIIKIGKKCYVLVSYEYDESGFHEFYL